MAEITQCDGCGQQSPIKDSGGGNLYIDNDWWRVTSKWHAGLYDRQDKFVFCAFCTQAMMSALPAPEQNLRLLVKHYQRAAVTENKRFVRLGILEDETP